MSETDNKPTLGRKPLGLKRSVEAGEVKQTFSHGRTNKVVVEVKRSRVLRKPGGPAWHRHRRPHRLRRAPPSPSAAPARGAPSETPGAPALQREAEKCAWPVEAAVA